MCCGSKGHHDSGHRGHHHGGRCECGCRCDCGCHGRMGPAFWTNEEKVAWLEERLESLREDVKTFEERIAALKGEE